MAFSCVTASMALSAGYHRPSHPWQCSAVRRMAALLPPPHQMGISALGAGERITSGKRMCAPSYATGSPVQSRRMASIISFRRAPRDAKSTPTMSNSSFIQPAETPHTTRPPDSSDAVATALAALNGSCRGAR